MELSFEEVVKAYFNCRKNKRNTVHQLTYEFCLEQELFDLYQDLKKGTYKIGPSVAFVVDQPKVREIWAATFRDRVVHHIIYNRLSSSYYKRFIRNSFACIPGRGTLDGSNRLMKGMQSITKNWQKPAYFLSADIRNFFVSINKNILWNILSPNIQEEWLRDLTHQVLFHDPRLGCIKKSNDFAFARVPKYKSLWNCCKNKGLPIGNLTSQFFANVYLNELDQFFVHHKGFGKYYFRYVDDFIILNESVNQLNEMHKEAGFFLKEKLDLDLHPYKKQIGLVAQGVYFVGYVNKPYRRYVRKRTINKAMSVTRQWKKSLHPYSEESLKKLRGSINAYMGIMKWAHSYKERKKLVQKTTNLYVRPENENYLKIKIFC